MEIVLVNKIDEEHSTERLKYTPSNKPRPEGLKETNDCVVVAFAEAFGLDYDKAHKMIAKETGRKNKKGTTWEPWFSTLATTKRKINGKIVKKLAPDFAVTKYPNNPPRKMTLEVFTRRYPKGTYMLSVRKHALVVRDGAIVDHTFKPLRRILSVFQIVTAPRAKKVAPKKVKAEKKAVTA